MNNIIKERKRHSILNSSPLKTSVVESPRKTIKTATLYKIKEEEHIDLYSPQVNNETEIKIKEILTNSRSKFKISCNKLIFIKDLLKSTKSNKNNNQNDPKLKQILEKKLLNKVKSSIKPVQLTKKIESNRLKNKNAHTSTFPNISILNENTFSNKSLKLVSKMNIRQKLLQKNELKSKLIMNKDEKAKEVLDKNLKTLNKYLSLIKNMNEIEQTTYKKNLKDYNDDFYKFIQSTDYFNVFKTIKISHDHNKGIFYKIGEFLDNKKTHHVITDNKMNIHYLTHFTETLSNSSAFKYKELISKYFGKSILHK